jgi:hypothetical protein
MEIFTYIMCWLASTIQKPWVKIGVMICLKGAQGSGKGVVLELIEKIMGRKHYQLVADTKHILGDFNGMLEGKTFINLNEAYWGGCKNMEGKVKNMITETSQIVNKKNKQQYTISCYANYFTTTNNEWFAGIDAEGRRWLCCECDPKMAGIPNTEKIEYFDEIRAVPPEAFAKVLYNWDISNWKPRVFPKTDLFQDQVERNWNPVEAFWFHVCENTYFTTHNFSRPWGIFHPYKTSITLDRDGFCYYSTDSLWHAFQHFDKINARKTGIRDFWKKSQNIMKIKESWNKYQGAKGKRYVMAIPIPEMRQRFNDYAKWKYEFPVYNVDLLSLNQEYESDGEYECFI